MNRGDGGEFDFRADFELALELRARAILTALLREFGVEVVWRDEGRFYDVADEADVPAAAAALGVAADREVVRRALSVANVDAADRAIEILRLETERRERAAGFDCLWVRTWLGRDGWYYSTLGIGWDGVYSERTPAGPYASRAEAREAAMAFLETGI